MPTPIVAPTLTARPKPTPRTRRSRPDFSVPIEELGVIANTDIRRHFEEVKLKASHERRYSRMKLSCPISIATLNRFLEKELPGHRTQKKNWRGEGLPNCCLY